MTDFAAGIETFSDRPVIDRTGLKGLFEINTTGWTPIGVDLDAPDPKHRPLLEMLEQFGLTIKYEKAPVETFVVDHVERPSGN